MLFQILYCMLLTSFNKIISNTINPTQQAFMAESTLADQNSAIYLTIESKFTPACYKCQNITSTNQYKQLIFVLQNDSVFSPETSFGFLYFLEIDPSYNTLIHKFEIETSKQKYYDSCQVQNTNYEGFWYTLEIRNDFANQFLNLTFYQNSNKNSILYQKNLVGETLLIKNTFSFYLGNSKISKSLNFSQLQGVIAYQLIDYQQQFYPRIETSYSSLYIALIEEVSFGLNTYYEFAVPTTISKSYGISTWVKINKNEEKIQNFVNVIQIQQNPNFQYLNQIGGKLLQISYLITSTKSFVEIIYQNYSFPILNKNENNEDPLERRIIQEIAFVIDLYQWHYLSVSYLNNTLILQLNFISQKQIILKTLEGINQFSDLTLVLHFGGTGLNFSNTDGIFALIYFYDFQSSFQPKCHFSCSSCFGPFYNQCITCIPDSNRFLSYNQDCICSPGYLETNSPDCFSMFYPPIQETYIPLSNKQGYDQEYPEIVCSYGYFRYDDECYACPKLNKLYFCPECIQYPNTWVFNPLCTKNYEQQNSNINNTFTNDIILNSTVLIYVFNPYSFYLFNDLQLSFCTYCQAICITQPFGSRCLQSDYYFLGKNIMVECDGYHVLIDGLCKICPYECEECTLINKEYICSNEIEVKSLNTNCEQSSQDKSCKSCNGQQNYFLNYGFTACIICSIPHCKLCFQYVLDNLYLNTIFTNKDSALYQKDDLIIGCALCENGFIFNFYTSECQRNVKISGEACSDYYISQENTTICLSSNSFSLGVQLNECHNYLSKCKKCISPTINQYYCLECDFGYFINTKLGICQVCSSINPLYLDCFDSQSLITSIYEMTPLFFSLTHQYPGILADISQKISLLQCIQGYFNASDFQCVQKDNGQCFGSEYHCTYCGITAEGTKRLTILNLKCSDCPYYCEYCKPRTNVELNLLNPYLNLTLLNYPYLTYRCIQKSSLHNNIFFDNKQQLSRLCTAEVPKCQLQLTHNFNNFLILDVILRNMDDAKIMLYYNLRSVNIIELSFETDQNHSLTTSFKSQTTYDNNLIAQIPSLHTTRLKIKFKSQNIGLLFRLFLILNCQEIYFEQATLFFVNSIQSFLAFESIGQIKFKLENIIIKSALIQDQMNFSKQFQIAVQNPSQINFTNVLIQNIQIKNSTFFNFTLVNDKFKKLEVLYFYNVTFMNCSFFSTSILSLLENNQYKIIQFYKLKFIQCSFIQSYFIYSENLAVVGSFLIQEFLITDSQFHDSIICLLPTYSNMVIHNLTVEKSQIENTDLLQASTSLNLSYVNILENILINFNFLKYSINKYHQKFKVFNLRYFKIQNNNYSQLQLVDIQQQSKESVKVAFFDLLHNNLTSQNIFNDRNYYFYNLIADTVIVERIIFSRSPGSIDFFIKSIFVQIIDTRVESNFYQNIMNLQNDSLNTFFIISSQKVEIKLFKFYNQFGVDAKFIIVNGNDNSNILNQINIEQLDIQNLQLIKTAFSQISTFFQSSCFIKQEVSIQNSTFQNVILNEFVQDSRVSSAALVVIISDLGIINLSSIDLNSIFVLNSTNPVFFIQSYQLNIISVKAQNINSYMEYIISDKLPLLMINLNKFMNSIQVNCLGGLFNIQGQQITISNSEFINSVALQGGVFYITTKMSGVVLFENNSFYNITTNYLNQQEGKGGCIFMNSENSHLQFYFIDNTIENSTSGFQAGAIYVKLSFYSSKIQISNIKLKNVFSFKNSIFYFQIDEINFLFIQKIVIDNLFVKNGYEEFLEYFEKFHLKASDISISEYNAMFYFSNFHTKISNLTFTGFTLQPIIYVKFRQYFAVHLLQIQNITHLSNTLIFFENSQANPTFMLINQMYIQNSSIQLISIERENIKKYSLKQLIEHKINIESTKGKALIQFRLQKNLKYSQLQLLLLIGNKCEICDAGLVNILTFQFEKKIRISNIVFLNNQCGITACLTMESQLDYQLYNIISESKFINNKANYSGVLKSQNFNIQLRNTSFIKNLALQNGGALFYNNTKINLKYKGTYFIQNQAEVGGAVFDPNIYNRSEENLYFFFQNKAQLYGNNLATQPTALSLSINGQITSLIENESLTRFTQDVYFFCNKKPQQFIFFPSGTSLNSYLKFDWKKLQFFKFDFYLFLQPKNLFGEDMLLNNGSFCLSNSSVISDMKENSNQEQTFQYIFYDIENHLFNLNDLVYILDQKTTSFKYIQVEIFCEAIQNYYLRFKVKSLKCQIGEYFENSQCKKCSVNEGYFSVKKNSTTCKKINIQMIKSTTGAMLELQPGYWRPNLRSDLIEECSKYSARCIGGWNVGDGICDLGAVGAHCEQCDIYNIRGDGSFINTNNERCSKCGETLAQVILILLQSLWIIFTVGLTVNSNHSTNKQLFVLKSIYRHYEVIYKQMMDQTSTLIKLANNHIQILSLIDSFQLQMIWSLKSFILFFGDSNYMISYQIDCSLPLVTTIEYEYSHYILIIIYPFFLFTAYIILLSVLLITKTVAYNKTLIYSAIIYLYCLNQQNLIKWGVFLIGKRLISGIEWIQANVSSRYDTETHYNWQIKFIYPMLVIIGVVIPLYLFLQLRSIKHALENRNACQKYSFLYHEYNSNSYFWEIIKMIQKISIILIVNYYEQFILIKGLIIQLVILLYYYACQKIQPYKLQSISIIDIRTSFILSLIIAASLLLYAIQKENMNYLNYQVQLVNIFLVICLVEILLQRIIKAYIQKMNLQFDTIRKKIIQKFPSIQKHHFLKPFIQLRWEKQQRIRDRFLKLKKYLKVQSHIIRESSLRVSQVVQDSHSIGINVFNSSSNLASKRGTNIQILD